MRRTISTRTGAALALVALLAAGVGCGRAGGGPEAPGGDGDSDKVITVGTIKSGFVGGGGEHTGWMLLRGGKEPDLEADVSGVLGRAKELEGTKVRVSGTLYEKSYVERGKVRILKIETLQPVPE